MRDPRQTFLQLIEMVLVGHGVRYEQLENTIDLADEILDAIVTSSDTAEQVVHMMMNDALKRYNIESDLTKYNLAFIVGAAKQTLEQENG